MQTNDSLEIEVHFSKEEYENPAKANEIAHGLGIVAKALGLGIVKRKNNVYPNGDVVVTFSAGQKAA